MTASKNITYKDETGKQFGRLTVIGIAGKSKNRQLIWDCKCACGKNTKVRGDGLRTGKVLSCGCYGIEQRKKANTVHNLSKSPEYKIWQSMKSRCYNDNNMMFYLYGERGITVSNSWNISFTQFYKDMGKRPSDNHSIERINNNLGYNSINCKWATLKEQSHNKRSNRIIVFKNKSLLLCEWAKLLNISSNKRLNNWTLSQALLTPKGGNKHAYT